eukprot:TRINITY_DN1798_c1_g1_i1.p1 TRINITY_DN1798_c1_g1~~TRINITY_DN1798_c1_g1_i1.p1  ORF type:complete len:1535 (+),score=240.64 TRINITY_DN1798_c1_g1_i1:273-4877(+)
MAGTGGDGGLVMTGVFAPMIKRNVQERTQGQWQVEAVKFGLLSSDEIARYGELEVMNPEKYDLVTRTPLPYGSLDRRLGCSTKSTICGTCNQSLEDCVGHFGHIKLALPVFHVGYLKHTFTLVQCICKACSRVLLPPQDRPRYLSRLRKPTTDDLQRMAIHKKLVVACKAVKHCPFCSAFNSTVKKGPGVPLIFKHQLNVKGNPDDVGRIYEESFQDAKANNKDLDNYLDNAQEDVSPLTVYWLLRNLPPQDRELLDLGCPDRMLISTLAVPPVCLRPTVSMGDAGMNEDDLTHAVSEIVTANLMLKAHLDKGGSTKLVHEAWKFLQDQCAMMINSEANGLELPKGRPIRSLCTRLKGKHGRFRGNLSGKRVDFSGRTVISPDPNVSVEQVVVPEWVAKRMTFPERVCEANIARLREAIRRGPEDHPGASFIRFADGRGKFLGALRKNFRRVVADGLRPGDLVERHMNDGDVVLFNRQPSLHRLSIMAHRAKVMPGRTLRFNECACSPYNADFDGDEMNLHLPQTEEAKAEAIQLMGVRQGLVTPKSGEVAVCATQDFLTASFLITQKDAFFSRDKFCQLCCTLTDGQEHIELPPPAIMKPCELWTGKQVFSVLLRPNRKSHVYVNLEAPEKNYTKKGESMCPNDGWIIFRNSELISGNLGKKILGGAKNGLFFRLIRDNSADAAVACMTRIAKLSSRWLMNRGFTIGIDDVCAHRAVKEEKARITADKYAVVAEKIKEYNAGTLPCKPGCNAEQTLEALVNGELGRIRDTVGGMCEDKLHFMNKPRIMAQCGSKGSAINLCQMMACVGQQNVGGQRIKDGFVKRTLPHFAKGSKEPKARGFVANSFYSGLEAPEFFFHTMGGREGLVDTAVKTAETGYMQRRLIKALEDLALKYDLTVRTSAGEVVQFIFGDDGLNPSKMEGSSSKPLDFDYVLRHVQCVLRPPRRKVNGIVQNGWVSNTGSGGRGDANGDPEAPPLGKKRRIDSGESVDEAIAYLPLPPASARSPEAIPRLAADRSQTGYLTRPLLPTELRELAPQCAERFCTWAKRTHGDAELDLSHMGEDIRGYIDGLSRHVAAKRSLLGFEPGDTAESAAAALASEGLDVYLALADEELCPTQRQLEAFVNRCAVKYVQAMLMPGEAVGAVAAQSIGEPATQMTLKTFHFAGVASMNVTLGVPRIKEIINASKTVSTPIITCSLVDPYSEASARIVKGRIERTTLGDVSLYFKEVYEPSIGCFISVKIDVETIRKLQLELTLDSIRDKILTFKNFGIRLAPTDVEVLHATNKLRIKPPKRGGAADKLAYFALQALKIALPRTVVHGIKSTVRTVINKDDKGPKTVYTLLVEGYGFLNVLQVPGISWSRTTSNHIMEVEQVLGIEAARRTIMSEISTTMGGHGIAVDARHVQMLGDCMTYRGQVLGINRYGISRMRSSALMLASFERTNDHIFDAAAHYKRDPIVGVSECIILGTNVKLGTGLFKVLYDFGGRTTPQATSKPIFSPGWREQAKQRLRAAAAAATKEQASLQSEQLVKIAE